MNPPCARTSSEVSEWWNGAGFPGDARSCLTRRCCEGPERANAGLDWRSPPRRSISPTQVVVQQKVRVADFPRPSGRGLIEARRSCSRCRCDPPPRVVPPTKAVRQLGTAPRNLNQRGSHSGCVIPHPGGRDGSPGAGRAARREVEGLYMFSLHEWVRTGGRPGDGRERVMRNDRRTSA